MGRIRTIKPEFTTNEDLSSLPAETHLFAAGLLCYADDSGFFNANPGLVKAAVFPLRETASPIQMMLKQLVKVGYLRLGKTNDGKTWGQIVNFSVHQYVNRPKASKISTLSIIWDEPLNDHGLFPEDTRQERKGKEQGTEREVHITDKTPLPDWLPLSEWNAFIEMRKKIKKPMTDRAKELAIEKLNDFRKQRYDITVILNTAVMNNWQGLYLPKDENGQQIKPMPQQFEVVEVSAEEWWGQESKNGAR